MRKFLLLVGWLAFGSSSAFAASSAMVLNVAGDVMVEAFGKASKVQPFSRILEGDRVKLPGDGRLTLVYLDSGRQEAWAGGGIIAAGESQSVVIAGAPQMQARQLPAAVVQQMTRTPLADAAGKAGMVRMRAVAMPDLAGLEQKYQELRREAQPDDRNPEIFYLAGLFERRAFERLEQEMARFLEAYPADESMQALAKLYTKAVADARQPSSR